MRIRYENTIEDAIAFNQNHYGQSRSSRRARWIANIWIILIVIYVACATFLLSLDLMVAAAGLGVLITTILLLVSTYRLQVETTIRQLYAESPKKGINYLGPHELELTERELVERSPTNESKWIFEGIERVATEGKYTFIYVGPLNAHIIPHARVLEGDPDAFVAALGSRLEAIAQRNGDDAEHLQDSMARLSSTAPQRSATALRWVLTSCFVGAIIFHLWAVHNACDDRYWTIKIGRQLERDLGFYHRTVRIREDGIPSPRKVVAVDVLVPFGIFESAGIEEGDIVKGMSSNEFFELLHDGRGKQVSIVVVEGGSGPPLEQRPERSVSFWVPPAR